MPRSPKSGYVIRTDKSWFDTEDDLRKEFTRWGVREWKAGRQGSTVTLRWIPKDSDVTVELAASDQWTAQDNFRKLYLIIEALRLNEARGFKQAAASYYAQTTALAVREDGRASLDLGYYTVLGVRPDADWSIIEAAYRALLKRWHPDIQANKELANAKTREINAAFAAIKEMRGES